MSEMDAKTLEALQASIEKWKRNAEVTHWLEAKIYGDDCPLCDLYFARREDCTGCPVFLKTGEHGCGGSPWEAARGALRNWRLGQDDGAGWREAALAEVAFLESLLPAPPSSLGE